MSDETVDHVARSRIDSHEEVCAQRYAELHSALAALNGRVSNAGGAIIVLLLGALGALVLPKLLG